MCLYVSGRMCSLTLVVLIIYVIMYHLLNIRLVGDDCIERGIVMVTLDWCDGWCLVLVTLVDDAD